MASFFVACHAPATGEAAVHDRSRCPPECFLGAGTTEYLGEFLEPAQALAVARLRYSHVHACPACEAARPRSTVPAPMALPTAPA
jgi:hypothetical protein